MHKSHTDLYIIALTSELCLDKRRVGAKAARLAAMVQDGFPVPPGFVISTDALRHVCRLNGLEVYGTKDNTQKIIQTLLAADTLGGLKQQLDAAVKALDVSLVAVRSSSTAEDQGTFSMAGQFETFLNTRPEDVSTKVRQCWASLFNKAPMAYRRRTASKGSLDMGVIVQAQVEARWAGVLFTLDPIQKSTDHFVLEWTEGLGDLLVSGKTEPHRIYVRRDNPVIPEKLPPDLATVLRQACNWAQQAEKRFKHPIDMEWAAHEKGFYIVQARPITGLSNAETVVWTNVNMAENFPHCQTPLTWSLVDRFYTAYIHATLRIFGWRDKDLARAAYILDNLTGIQAGRVYYRLNNWYTIMHFFPCSRWLTRFLNHYIGQKIPFEYQPKPSEQHLFARQRKVWTTISFWPRMLNLIITAKQRMDAFEPAFYQKRQQWRETDYNRLSTSALLQQLKQLLAFIDRTWAPPAIADLLVMILPGLVDVLTAKWIDPNAESMAVHLYQGLDLISIHPSVMIWEIAREVEHNSHLRQLIKAADYDTLAQDLSDPVRKLRDRFMHLYGGRCFHDCTLIAPTFMERHDLLWKLVESYLDGRVAHPLSGLDAKRKQRQSYVRKILDQLGPLQRVIYNHLLRLAQQAVQLRERGRLLQSLLFGEMRLIAIALGRQLQAKSVLADAQEIFYLGLDEIEKLILGKFAFPETLPQIIAARQKALNQNNSYDPPSFFFLDPGEVVQPIKTMESKKKNIPNNMLKGTAVAAGRIQAPGRVILDPFQSQALRPGDVLITRATDPGWTPLFSIAGGLVLERGGLLSHGAIVAREFGIPAVAGVENATRIIKNGRIVIVDGDQGTVQFV